MATATEIREAISNLTEAIETATDKAAADDMRQTRARLQAELMGRKPSQAQVPDHRGVRPSGSEDRQAEAFTNYLRYGERSPELRLSPLSTAPGAPSAGSTLAGEGGYLVPQGFWDELIVARRKYAPGILADCRTIDTPESGNPMPFPVTDPTAIFGSTLTENTQVTEVDFTFGQGMLSAWTYTSGLHLASIQIVNDSYFNVDTFVRDRVAEAIGRETALHAISGTGSAQFLGIITALVAKGAATVGTGSGASGGFYMPAAAQTQQVLGGTSASPVTSTELALGLPNTQDLLAMMACVDPFYRETGNCKWYTNDLGLKNLRTYVDFYGHPLLQQPSDGMTPPRLWGHEVIVDPQIPSVAGVASTPGGIIFGDMQYAMLHRRGPAGVLALHERYADFLQVGWVGYTREDLRSLDLRAAVVFKTNAT